MVYSFFNIVKTIIKDWVDEGIDNQNIHIDVLGGTYSLTNANLIRRKIHTLNDFTEIKLRKGSIGELKFCIPWYKFLSGDVSIVVKEFTTLIEIQTGDVTSNAPTNKADKMAQVIAEQIKTLEGNERNSFVTKLLYKVLRAALLKFVSRCEISVERLRLFFLLPCDKGSHLILELSVDSLSLCPDDLGDRKSYLSNPHNTSVGKNFIFRNISIHAAVVKDTPEAISSLIDEKMLFLPLLANIDHILMNLHCSDVSSLSGLKCRTELGNSDLFIGISLLKDLCSTKELLARENIRSVLRNNSYLSRLCMDLSNENILFDARTMWQKAIRNVLTSIKIVKRAFGGSPLRQHIECIGLRKKYIALYQRVLLDHIRNSSALLLMPCNSACEDLLSEQETKQLHKLEDALSCNDLISCRMLVCRKAMKCGASLRFLSTILMTETQPGKQQYQYHISGSKSYPTTNFHHISFDVAKFLQYEPLAFNLSPSSQQQYLSKIFFTIISCHISIFDRLDPCIVSNESKEQVRGEVAQEVFLIVISGVAIDLMNTASLYNLYLGSLSLYGCLGAQYKLLLSVGDINRPFQEADFRLACFVGNPILALSLSLQYVINESQTLFTSRSTSNDIHSFVALDKFTTIDKDGKVNHHIIQPTKEHCVVETKMSLLCIVWSPDYISLILKSINQVKLFVPSKKPITLADEKLRLARLSIYNSMGGILPEKVKISVSVVASNWKVTFPIVEDTGTPYSSGRSLVVGFEQAQVTSGDYLETVNGVNRQMKNTDFIHEEREGDEFIESLQDLMSLHHPVISSFALSMKGLSCYFQREFWSTNGRQLMSEGRNLIPPWSIKGIVSVSSLYSHPDFVDSEVSLHLEDLQMILCTKDILDLITIATSVCKVMIADQSINKLNSPPRIKRLEGCSYRKAFLSIKRLDITWAKDDSENRLLFITLEQAVRHALQSPEFGIICAMDENIIRTYFHLLARNMRNLTFLQSEEICKITNRLASLSLVQPKVCGSFRSTIESQWHEVLNLSEKIKLDNKCLCSNSLFSIEIANIKTVLWQLYSETQWLFNAEEISFKDADHLSLISFSSALDMQQRDSHNLKRRNIKFCQFGRTAFSKVPSLPKGLTGMGPPAAVSLFLKNSMREASQCTSALYADLGENTSNSDAYAKQEVDVRFGDLDLFVSTERMIVVANDIGKLYERLVKDLATNKEDGVSNSEKKIDIDFPINSEQFIYGHESIKPSMYIEFYASYINVLISCNHELFSSMHLHRIESSILRSDKSFELLLYTQDLAVLDLSAAGQLYRYVLWSNSSDERELIHTQFSSLSSSQGPPLKRNPVLIFQAYIVSNSMRINVHFNNLRITFLYRFIMEFVDKVVRSFVSRLHSRIDIWHNHDVVSEESGPSSTERSNNFDIWTSFVLEETQGFVPRNSFSEEVIGLTIDRVEVNLGDVISSWSDLDKETVDKVAISRTPWRYHIYFDLKKNEWLEGNDNTLGSQLFGDKDDFEDGEDAGGDGQCAMNDFFHDSLAYANVESPPIKSIFRASIEGSGITIFTSIPTSSQLNPELRTSSNENDDSYSRMLDGYSKSAAFDQQTKSSQSDENRFSQEDIMTGSRVILGKCRFAEISAYHEVLRFGECSNTKVWQIISRSKLNLQVVIDIASDKTRLLFGDTRELSRLDVAMSQAEFYLLMCLWFDNVHECPHFQNHGDNENQVDSSSDMARSSFPFEDYGSPEYLSYYLKRDMSFELIVVRADVRAAVAVDVNSFSHIPGFLIKKDHLSGWPRSLLSTMHDSFRSPLCSSFQKEVGSNHKQPSYYGAEDARKVVPVAELACLGLVLSVKLDFDVVQLSLSAGLCEVYDIMQPDTSSCPLVLRLAPVGDPTSNSYLSKKRATKSWKEGCYNYGHQDLQYGYHISSDMMDFSSTLPLKMSLLLPSSANWLTLNLGVDLADFNLERLEVVYLLTEFFSCFFRFREFGHPNLLEYYRIEKFRMPYGGTDFRLFIMRPHISILDSNSSSTLFLEVERSAYFRYTLDTCSAVKMELNANDLAVVLMKQYRAPDLSRGIRGSSGSGRGIRTMVEYLNTSVRYSHIPELKQVDFQIEVYIPDDDMEQPEKSPDDFLNLNCSELNSDPIVISEPTCLLPVIVSNKDFTNSSVNLVASYEDAMFCISLFEQLFPVMDDAHPAITEKTEQNFFSNISINGVRFLLVDNVLGLHLPLFQVFLQSIRISVDCKSEANAELPEHSSMSHNLKDQNQSHLKRTKIAVDSLNCNDEVNNSPNYFLYSMGIFWIDYFNNLKKCWEPLTEKLVITVQKEQSNERGVGLIVRSLTSVQVYFTGALIRTITDSLRTFQLQNVYDDPISKSKMDPRDTNDWFDEISLQKRRNSLDGNKITISEAVSSYLGHKQSPGVKGGTRRRGSLLTGRVNMGNALIGSDKVDHIPSLPLLPSQRVGFSILNLTGQSIRYLQQWEGGKKTVQYLNNNERGLLNIVAAQSLIRNGKIVEETFEVQQERIFTLKSRTHKRTVGNKVALQVMGYRWLHSVLADELGAQYEELFPILGRVDATRVFRNDKIASALQLMVEVLPYCGGRMLRLRSVFSVKNCTKHSLSILARRGYKEVSGGDLGASSEGTESAFILDAEDEMYLPIALLYQSILTSQGKSLGLLNIKPNTLQPLEEELESRLGVLPGSIEYSTDPISLFHILDRQLRSTCDLQDSGDKSAFETVRNIQLCCHVNPKQKQRYGRRSGRSKKNQKTVDLVHEHEADGILTGHYFAANKLPPFCYSVEIVSNTESNSDKLKRNLVPVPPPMHPKHFTIAIHPPIVVENLLPCYGVFELLHAEHKRVVWSSSIAPGASKAIHTVTLEEPLLLVINLRYCRASEGVLIHRPHAAGNAPLNLVGRLQKVLEGILDDTESDDVSNIILTDTVGQKLRLSVENTQGAGSQRHIVVYCPYWIVNTSQYAFRLREEGEMDLTAGSVNMQRDGTRPVPLSSATFPDKAPVHEIYDPNRFIHDNTRSSENILLSPSKSPRHIKRLPAEKKAESENEYSVLESVKQPVFPGCCGPLHYNVNKEIPLDSPLCDLLGQLDIADITKMSYMFNYRDSSSVLTNSKKVKLQLDDTDWSRSFSLESVGVNQVLSIEHPSRGLLEVGMKVNVAPGKLSKYTKIIRLQPRYAIVNRLTFPLRIVQASGFGGETIELEVTNNHIRSYHLPVLFGERSIALVIEGQWKRSVFFNLDQIGAFTIEVRRFIDLASIPHVNTRGAPEYVLFLPALRVIGLSFETDWGEENIVVKAIQSGSFAAREADIRIGDVLLAINGEPISGSQFELAMIMLKSKLSDEGCYIKLRTIEEKLRLIRESALHNSQKSMIARRRSQTLSGTSSVSRPANDDGIVLDSLERDVFPLRVELRLIESTVMIQVSELSHQAKAEYLIENGTGCYKIHFKQKGIPGGSWRTLNPGQSCVYIWQDPFKPHKLLVHVGDNMLCPSETLNRTTLVEGGELGERGRGDETLGKYLSYLAGVNNDNASVINFDEIGSKEFLCLGSKHESNRLLATVKSEGPTKILLIVPSLEPVVLQREIRFVYDFLEAQIKEYFQFVQSMSHLPSSVAHYDSPNLRMGSPLFIVETHMHSLLYTIIDRQRMTASKKMQSHPHYLSDPTNELASFSKMSSSLISFKPFERLYESGIERIHQVLVEVIEARDLSPLVRGKTEDVYCKLYIRNEEGSVIDKARSQAFFTYVCDQTLEPQWLQQRFVFDVIPETAVEYRHYALRILVKAKSLAGVDNVIAKLDVPFSCLKEEKSVEGWFPLRPPRSSLLLQQACGSIKLKLQWIHSSIGLFNYICNQTERRLNELKTLQGHLRRLYPYTGHRQYSDKASLSEITGKESNSSDLPRVDSGYLLHHPTLKREIILNSLDTRMDEGLTKQAAGSPILVRNSHNDAVEEVKSEIVLPTTPSDDDCKSRILLEDVGSPLAVKPTSQRQNSKRTAIADTSDSTLFISSFAPRYRYRYIFNEWINAMTPLKALHARLGSFMTRSDSVARQNDLFRSNITRESLRSFTHAFTQTGSLQIAPIQALHLPVENNYVHIKLSYGNENFTTSSVPPAAFTTWYHDSLDSHDAVVDGGYDTYAHDGDPKDASRGEATPHNLWKTFDIDLLNVKGNILVRVMAEVFPKSKEVARVELPVFGVVDCTCLLGGSNFYDRWFPLTLTSKSSSDELKHANCSSFMTSEDVSYSKFGYQPCIRLRLRWVPSQDMQRVENAIFYGRVQIPSVTMSFVDSEYARTVMLASVSNLEARRAVTNIYTDVSIIVDHLQVDNQLPEPMTNVVLAPKLVKAPQPVIRLHFRRKNILSQKNLECYQTIQMVVQEVDLKLEQQIVLASWALLKNWLHESKLGFEFLNSQSAQKLQGLVSINDKYGNNDATPHGETSIFASLLANSDTAPMRPRSSSVAVKDVRILLDTEALTKLYIEDFRIFPIKINVSFLLSPAHSLQVYRRQLKQLEVATENTSYASAVSFFLWQVGEVVLDLTSSISDAPLFFNGFEAPHLFKTHTDVTRILQEHYLHSALGQLYKIVGSLDLVGNPIGLLSSLGVGVRDFFYEPAHAIITSPTAFGKIGKGVVKGTVSLVSNTTVGFLGTGTTITRSVGRGIAKLSLDNSYIKAREKLQKTPSSTKDLLLRPVKDLSCGLTYSIAGLVKVPYKSVKEYGVRGIVPGLLKGAAGLVVDPAVGILDAVTHSGDACKEILKNVNSKGMKEETARVRLGDLFGPDGRLLPYSFQIALGTQVISAFKRYSNRTISNDTIDMDKTLDEYSWSSPNRVFVNRDKMSMDRLRRRRSVLHIGLKDSMIAHNSDEQSHLSSLGSKRASMVIRRNRFSFRSLDDSTIYGENSVAATIVEGEKSQYPSPSRFEEDEGSKDHTLRENNDINTEFVIYAATLRQAADNDLVVIISTLRLVLVSYGRKSQGSYVDKRWEVPLFALLPPVLDRTGGSTATLLFRTLAFDPNIHHVSNEGKTKVWSIWSISPVVHRSTDPYFSLTSNYQEEDILINIFNSLNAVLGNFVPLIPTYNSNNQACQEDEYGIRHIGPWQFVARKSRLGDSTSSRRQGPSEFSLTQEEDKEDQAIVEMNRNLIRELELEVWFYKDINTAKMPGAFPRGASSKPSWLQEEEESALRGHENVQNLYRRCKQMEQEIISDPYKKTYLRIPIESLFKGHISSEEFEIAIKQAPRLLEDEELSKIMSNGDKESDAGTKSSWRHYLGLGQSPSRIEQKSLTTTVEGNRSPSASSAAEPPSSTSMKADENAHESSLSPIASSIQGIFHSKPVEDSKVDKNLYRDEIDSTFGSAIVQKAPFVSIDVISPPHSSMVVSSVYSIGSVEDDVDYDDEYTVVPNTKEQDEEGKNEFNMSDVGFTYSDLTAHRDPSLSASSVLSPMGVEDKLDLIEERINSAIDPTLESQNSPIHDSRCVRMPLDNVSGVNPLFIKKHRQSAAFLRPEPLRGASLTLNFPYKEGQEQMYTLSAKQAEERASLISVERRWSSPAVLPRINTPPKSVLTPTSSSKTNDRGRLETGEKDMSKVIHRLDEIEALIKNCLLSSPGNDQVHSKDEKKDYDGEEKKE